MEPATGANPTLDLARLMTQKAARLYDAGAPAGEAGSWIRLAMRTSSAETARTTTPRRLSSLEGK